MQHKLVVVIIFLSAFSTYCSNGGQRQSARVVTSEVSVAENLPSDDLIADVQKANDAEVEDVGSDTIYISAKHSDKCLTIKAPVDTEDLQVVQAGCEQKESQKFEFRKLDTKSFHIVSTLTDLCLGVINASLNDGAIVQQGVCSSTAGGQLWRITNNKSSEAEGANEFMIETTHSAMCLDVKGNSLEDGAAIIQRPCNFNSNQIWRMSAPTVVNKAEDNSDSSPVVENTGESPVKSKRDTSEKPKIYPSIVQSKPIACHLRPDVTIETTMEWNEDIYGNNAFYSNFFTPLIHYKGSTYFVWIDNQSQPKVSVITQGKVKTVLLSSNYKTRRDSHNLYSLGIDRDGYIHIAGDMQNGPNMRSKDYPQRYHKASILYWVSVKPENIESGFEFHGDTERAIPAAVVNGIRFFTDNTGELYSSAAVDAIGHGHRPGRRGIGLYRYDPSSKKWAALGGKATPTADTAPSHPLHTIFFWEVGGVGENMSWQGFFSYFKFDMANRLHFATAVNNDSSEYENQVLYAVSPDGGKRWQKAKGEQIKTLPLRAAHNHPDLADVVLKAHVRWHTNVLAYGDGRPVVYGKKIEKSGDRHIWYLWDNTKWTASNKLNDLDPVPHSGQIGPGGSLVVVPNEYSNKIYCQENSNKAATVHDIPALKNYTRFTNVDEYGLRTSGAAYGVAVNTRTGKQSILKVQFKTVP